MKGSLRESQLGHRERYQRLVTKARTQLDETRQQSLENLLTTAKQQQGQLAQDEKKTWEETKRGQPIANKKRKVKPPIESVSG